MANNVVPFGKYKGQPVAAMQADREYVDWLMGQAWFKDKHQNIYTLIVNNFAEPSETPAHNALQGLFLDNEFAEKVVFYCYGNSIIKKMAEAAAARFDERMEYGIDVSFEVSGADVYCCFGDLADGKFRIEIKPSVGDDYPAILRQIKNIQCRGRPILFLENYSGSGVTQEQFVEIFWRSGIKVAFCDEVIAYPGPDRDLIGLAKRMGVAAAKAERAFYANKYPYFSGLHVVDGVLWSALCDQENLFEDALGEGDAGEIRTHGEALCRGWAAGTARMEELERARLARVAADTAAYQARQDEIKKELVCAQQRADEQRQIERAKQIFPGASVIGVRKKSGD